MPSRISLVPRTLARDIESAITATSPSSLTPFLTAGGRTGDSYLVIKYVPARYCRSFRPDLATGAGGAGIGPRLRISDSPGFTWGTGNYVTPLAFPISTAIYGRAGIVAVLDQRHVASWRLFDARVPSYQDLYLQWTMRQPAFRWLTLTCHANLANQFLRNAFRETLKIDCVMFHPDQRNAYYTQQADLWLCVSDWTSYGRLARGDSNVLRQPRLAILVSEEFSPIGNDVRRQSVIGPRGALPSNATLASDIRTALNMGSIIELTT